MLGSTPIMGDSDFVKNGEDTIAAEVTDKEV
jgi:hypothetical protein